MLPRQPYLYWCQRWEPHNKAWLVSAHVLLSHRVWIYVLLGVGAEGKKRVLNYTYFIYAFNETCSWNLRRKWCEGFYEFKSHFVFYPLNITFWGLGQVVWINWIRTQSFVPGKKYFSPHMETTCTPPHQSSFSLKQIYQGRTRLHLQNLSTNQPTRDPQQGYQPLFPVEPPKASFFVLLQGTVCQGNPLAPIQAEQGTSRARRDPCASQSPWRKGIPPKVDPNLQPYLKIKLSSFVCARCAGATPTLNKKGAK